MTDLRPRLAYAPAGCCAGTVRDDPQQIDARIKPPACASPWFHVWAVVSGAYAGYPLYATGMSANRNSLIKVGSE